MDFNQFLQEQFENKDFTREYYREATFFRLADQMILLRKRRGLTQKELATKAQTTQAVISRLENVSVRPSLETIVHIAEALDAVVEVHLIPTEELKEKKAPEQMTEQKKPAAIPDDASLSCERLEIRTQVVTWNMPNCWSLTSQPTLQPVGKKRRIPDFA